MKRKFVRGCELAGQVSLIERTKARFRNTVNMMIRGIRYNAPDSSLCRINERLAVNGEEIYPHYSNRCTVIALAAASGLAQVYATFSRNPPDPSSCNAMLSSAIEIKRRRNGVTYHQCHNGIRRQ